MESSFRSTESKLSQRWPTKARVEAVKVPVSISRRKQLFMSYYANFPYVKLPSHKELTKYLTDDKETLHFQGTA